MAAELAGPQRQSFRIGVDLARIGRGTCEGVVAEVLARLFHDRAGHGLRQRLVRIFVGARPLEHVAARNLRAAQVAGLAGDAADLLEVIVIRLEFVVADGEILDRHLGGNGVAAVTLAEMRLQFVVRRQDPPRQAVPVRARAAKPGAGQERAEPSDRQRRFRRRMPEGNRLLLRILEQLLAHGIFEIVAHVRQREVLGGHPLGAAFETNNSKSGLGEFAGHDAAGPTDTDHHRIDFLEHGCHDAAPLTRSPRSNAAACRRPCRDTS